MPRIAIGDLQPGMVLAEDVEDSSGRVLLSAGATVMEAQVRILQARKVASVVVEGEEEEAEAISGEIIARAREHLARFFLFVDLDQAAVREIYRLAVLMVAERMARGEEPEHLEESSLPDPESLPQDLFFRGEGTPQDIVRQEVTLSSLPDIFFRVVYAIDTPGSSARDVADVVEKDTALSARLLRLVNSPYYGFASRIDSISRAVAVIGINDLMTLVAGITAILYFKDIPPQLVNMKSFWRHSVACGLLARSLARGREGAHPERLFVAGLLHDIGRLVLYKRLPYASTQAVLYSRANSVPAHVAESESMGFDHARIGALLMTEWKLPSTLVEIVRSHHAPMTAENPLEPAFIHLADNLAIAMELGEFGFHIPPGVEEGAWRELGLKAEELADALEEARTQLDDIVSVFLSAAS